MEEWLHLVTKDTVVIIDAMALIRTFLNFFLERDLAELRVPGAEP